MKYVGFGLLSHFQVWPARVVRFVLHAYRCPVHQKPSMVLGILSLCSVLTATPELGIVSMYQKKETQIQGGEENHDDQNLEGM